MSNFFVPTRFTWRFGGSVVHLCGSFTRWVETVPMQMVPDHPELFTVIVHLPPGYHQYKFIVDGEWRHDETQPYMPDPLGNVNNWLFVRRIEETYSQAAPEAYQQAPQAGNNHHAHHGQQQQPAPQRQQQYQSSEPSHDQMQDSIAHSPRSLQRPSDSQAMSVEEPSHDVEMATAESLQTASPTSAYTSPAFSHQAGESTEEPAYTRKRIHEFLETHTCYELIPESGKVVLLDLDLPVRQAFHALHEQGVPSAPLWDSDRLCVVGMISASDFIHVLRRLRGSLSSGNSPMSEAEMDSLTIKDMREQSTSDGRPPKELVFVSPANNLQAVIKKLFDNRCSMAPVVTSQNEENGVEDGMEDESGMNTLLHIATISGILANLMGYFRANLSSLPLLNEEVGRLPIGTWSSGEQLPDLDPKFLPEHGQERRDKRKIGDLNAITPDTPLTVALSLLLEAGVSTLPVIHKDSGQLLDMYARSDITMLARGNSYSRLQWEDMTVGQALDLPYAPDQAARPNGGQSPSQSRRHSPRQSSEEQRSDRASSQNLNRNSSPRVHICTVTDSLRSVVERLSKPGIRRIFVVDRNSRKPLGIISLSDVAAFLFSAI